MPYPFSQYPAQIDNSTSLPPVVDLVSPVRGEVVNSLRNTIINIENTLGTNPNSTYGTVAERINVLEAAIGSGGLFEAGGDLSGTGTNQTVIGIQTRPVSNVPPSIGQGLVWSGSEWVPGSQALTGIAGGNLSGFYPNPTVISINGAAVPSSSGSLVTGNGLYVSGTSSLAYSALNLAGGSNYVSGILPTTNLPSATTSSAGIIELSNDLGGISTSPSVLSIHGATIPIAGGLTTGNGLYVSGTSALSYSALNLAGGANYVTGLLPAVNQASQTMTGDVTGTTSANTVAAIQGHAVSSASISKGQFLVGSGTNTWAPETISGDISSSAVTAGALTVTALQGNAVASGTLTSAQDGYVLTWEGTNWQAQPITSGSITLSGDVTGAASSNTVVKIQGNSVVSGGITEGQFLVASASNTWSAKTISGDISSSVSTAGKLTVTGLQGNTFTSGAPTKGQFVLATSTSNYGAGTITGDINASSVTAGLLTVTSITGTGGFIPFNATIEGTSGSSFPVSYSISNVSMTSDANLTLSASQLICPILRVTSSVSLTATRSIILPTQSGAKYDVYNGTTGGQSLLFIGGTGSGITVPNGLKTSIYFDGTNYVTAAIVIGGDLSATSNIAQTVIKIQGNAISNTAPSDGYVLTWSALNNQWMPEAITSGSVTLTGDVTGAATSNVVSGIKGVPVLAAPTTIGQTLVYNGVDWVASLAAQVKSTTYTVATTDGDIYANLTSNGWTLTLPPSPFTGEKHTIKDFDGYAGHTTINGSAASLTFSSPTMTLTGGSGFTSAMTGLNITISNSFLTGTGATLSFTTPTVTLAGGSGFTSAMTGLPITITGSTTAANNGTFILTYISSSSVSWSNSSGAANASTSINWSVNETVNNGTFPLTYVSSTSVSWTNSSGIANSGGAIVWSVPNNLIISGNGNNIEQWGGTGTASTLLLSQNYDSVTLGFSGTGGVGTWNII
jgi:hypothetical protein